MAESKGTKTTAEDVLVNTWGAMGGEQAGKDARAAWDAGAAGHLIDSLKLSLKSDADIIAHATGHDPKPMQAPPAAEMGKSQKSR